MSGWRLLVALAVSGCAAGGSGGEGREGSGQTSDAGDGGSQPGDGSAHVQNGTAGAGGAAPADDAASPVLPDDYSPSCDEQECTADERCLTISDGSHCVHPCEGQPCPPGDKQVPYCTRTGGVICAEE